MTSENREKRTADGAALFFVIYNKNIKKRKNAEQNRCDERLKK